ncbi:MAG: DUF2007 domain-containing protein [Xanthomonadaceae bacterium]|jgi:hypothetical protein|nr:DUF2007 domain-containing protein [Xanthomonadaceae bacterium]
MRIVYQAENVVDAHLVKGALEAAGIPAHVAGEYLTGAIGELPVAGLVAVMVPEHAVAAALGVVQGVDEQLREARSASAADPDLPDSILA